MSALFLLCLILPAERFVEVDFRTVPRTTVKEPRYIAQPLYALLILDPAGRFRVWVVLDKTRTEQPYYDVVYLDRNGDGDLTDPGKRFVGTYNGRLKTLNIPVGDVPVPGTRVKHTGLRFVTVEPHGYPGFWFSFKWAGVTPVSGGYGPGGERTTMYARTPPMAPILRPTPAGLLSFTSWEENITLPIGKAKDIQLGIGNPGSGTDTFCALDEHFLQPGKDTITATLIARDRQGKELRTAWAVKKHC